MSSLDLDHWLCEWKKDMFKCLLAHRGHDIELVDYPDKDDRVERMTIVCLNCNQVLFNFEK